MSYIAADMWGEHLFYNKPVRYVHETTKRSWWIDPKHNNSISVPIGTAKLFNDAGDSYILIMYHLIKEICVLEIIL